MKNKLFLVAAAILIFLLAFPAFAQKPKVYFPYSRIYLKYAALEEPYPGLGSNYSSLANGMQTALWNPAGLSKIATMEQTLSFLQTAATASYVTKMDLDDTSQTMGDNNEVNLLILYTGDESETTATSREMVITSYADSQGAPVSVSQAMKVNDWLHLGFMTKGDFGAGLTFAGLLPNMIKYQMDFSNLSMGSGFAISSGKLKYTTGGTTYETSQPLWSGFLSQNSTLPASTYTNLDNSINVQNNFIITASTNYGPVALGMNFIPISATTQINNSVKTVLSNTATDLVIYTPDIDTSDPASVVKWVQDPDLYTSQKGYKGNTVAIPAGKAIIDSAFKGTYSGNTVRTDIGLTVDLGTDAVASAVIENYNSAQLKLKGTGITSYVVHRINTAESFPTLDLTKEFNWSPFYDSPTPYSGFNYTLASEQTYNLPRRIRYGLFFKKPFMLAIDYEQQTNPYEYKSLDENGDSVTTKFKNITVLRVGTEMQIMVLPIWFQLGTAFLFKPEVEGYNAAAYQKQIDDAYSSLGLGVIPVRLDLGLNTKAWKTTAGIAMGVNALSLLDMMQLDMINSDVNHTAFFSAYVNQGPWKFTWAMNLDEIATAASISNKTAALGTGESYSLDIADLKWRTTYMISYKF